VSVTDPRHAPPVQRGREDVALLLVSHDGARWLPAVLKGIEEQETAVSCAVAVDTGSTDESAELLTQAFGSGQVVQAPSSTTFPAAVRLGLDQLRGLGVEPEWVWLLHDDSSPHPEALLALLAGAAEQPDADVLGPMLREWPSLKRLLELGVTISGTGRRETGLERGEYDQGQYSEPRTVLAVNTAGMLVRRRVLEELDGFDDELPIFGNDIDFGWRAALAGHRTIVVPQAVVFHAEAAHRGLRRTALTGRHTHYQERRAALFTLLANSRTRPLPLQLLRLTLGTLVRMLGLLLVRAPGAALDELAALLSVASGPRQLLAARRLRRAQTSVEPAVVRTLLAPWWLPYRHGFDAVSDFLAAANQQAVDVADRRRAAAAERDPSSFAARRTEHLEQRDDDDLADTGLVARFLTNPVAVLLAVFVVAALVGAGDAFGSVSGAGLSPAPAHASDWWSLHLASWHELGLGTPVPAPAYVLPLALVATVLGPALTISALWVLAVPLSLWGAWRFLRVAGRLATPTGAPRWLILWAATSYALVPVLSGAWGDGWMGPVVAGVVLPWLAHASLGFADPEPDRRWRAAWRAGLLLALVTVVTPVAWVFAALVGLVVVVLAFALLPSVMQDRSTWAPPAAAVAVVPVLLSPWWLPALVHGAGQGLWLDAGRVRAPVPSGLDLALGRYGDLGAPWWLGVVLPVLALLALLPRATRTPVLICWVVAVVAAVLAAGLAQVRLDLVGLTVPPGTSFLLVVGQGALVVATMLGALSSASAGRDVLRSWRAAAVPLVVVLALVLPIGGLVWFLGFSDPSLGEERDPGIPAYMVLSSEAGPEHGILVVRGSVETGLTYSVRRGDGVTLGEDEVLALTDDDAEFTSTVRRLAARPDADIAGELGHSGIEYVVLPTPADPDVAASIDATIGLAAASAEDRSTRAWQVDRPVSADAVEGPRSWLRIGLLMLQLVALLVVAVLCAPTTERRR
jgi:GT2 family glycosyltransferase